MIPRCRICKIVRCVQYRAIPDLVKISVKLVRARLCNVVDLRRSVPSLVHRVGKRVHRHFRYRVQSEDEVCRESAVQICQRVVRFQTVNDIAV